VVAEHVVAAAEVVVDQLLRLPAVDAVRVLRHGADGTRAVLAESPAAGSGPPVVLPLAGRWGSVEVHSDAPAETTRAAAGPPAALAALALTNAEARDELDRARLRGLVAHDDELRRLEREIHGGIQQRLTTTAMELQLVLDERHDDTRRPAMGRIVAQLDDMSADVRELSRRVYPASLADGGVGPAVRSLGRRAPLPVEVHVDGTQRYPTVVEMTALLLVTDVVRGAAVAAAEHVVVRIAPGPMLTLTVVGAGLADHPGMVTEAVRDRLGAVGARWRTHGDAELRIEADLSRE
jgi:signal transduction histidine kinase